MNNFNQLPGSRSPSFSTFLPPAGSNINPFPSPKALSELYFFESVTNYLNERSVKLRSRSTSFQ